MSAPSKKRSREISEMGASSLDPSDRKSFQNKRAKYTEFSTPASDSGIRLAAKKHAGDRFGTGYDEMYPTRVLKKHQGKLNKRQREQVFSQRAPTKHLVWANTPGKGVPPISGHVPSLKDHTGGGNKGTMTTEHGTRDGLREKSIETTLAASGALEEDPAIIARLATIKHMIAPRESLATAGKALAKHPTPVYSAHSHVGDLRKPGEFKKMQDITQDVRETMKWTTGSLMRGSASKPLVPPQMEQYLKKANNDPYKAMSTWRGDLGKGKVKSSNRGRSSATDDFGKHSLASMRKNGGRALSPPREIAPTKPKGS